MSKYASIYFSPNRGTAQTVCGFIDKTTETLDIAIYALTHDEITNAIIRAFDRGVKIRILIDRLQASHKSSDDETLEKVGIPLKVFKSSGLMHHKLAISDNKAVLLGSFNWTQNADTRNAENLVIVRLSYIIKQCQEEFEKLWNKQD